MATKALETLRKAVSLKQNSTRWYALLQSTVQDEIRKIQENRDYSSEYKAKLIGELKEKRGIEIMQQLDKRKQAYLRLLNQAKKQAEDTIYFSLKKPSDDKVKMFNADLKYFKTKLMLARTGDDVLNGLKEFIKKIETEKEDERAYFATELANQFDEIITTALNIDSSDKMKHELKQMYEHLYYELQTDDVKEAREVLDTLGELFKKPNLIGGFLVEQNANDLFGRRFAEFMNEPEKFFDQPEYGKYKRTYSDKELDEYVEQELEALDE